MVLIDISTPNKGDANRNEKAISAIYKDESFTLRHFENLCTYPGFKYKIYMYIFVRVVYSELVSTPPN